MDLTIRFYTKTHHLDRHAEGTLVIFITDGKDAGILNVFNYRMDQLDCKYNTNFYSLAVDEALKEIEEQKWVELTDYRSLCSLNFLLIAALTHLF